jgi:hypothetical protein
MRSRRHGHGDQGMVTRLVVGEAGRRPRTCGTYLVGRMVIPSRRNDSDVLITDVHAESAQLN